MQVLPISPPVGVAYVRGRAEDDAVLFGCFSEVNKWINARGWAYPHTVVLPDVNLVNRVPQFAPEFLFYGHVFRQNHFDFGEMKVKEPITFVGSRSQLERVRDILDISFLGCEPHVLDRIGVSGELREDLEREGSYFALKSKDGKTIPLDDYIRLVEWNDATVELPNGMTISRRGDAAYHVSQDGESVDVVLSYDGDQPPVWQPLNMMANMPFEFGLHVLGSYDGFDPKGPSTTHLLWLNGHRVLLDCAPHAERMLEGLGIAPDSIDGIIVTHVHEDHTGGLAYFALASHRMRVWSTEPIWESVKLKLAATLDVPAEEIAERFRFQELPTDEPYLLYGAAIETHYSCHSVPTIGMRLRCQGETLTISGDIAGHEYLNKMLDDGALSKKRYELLEDRIYANPGNLVADAGEALIHGYPKDYHLVGRNRLYLTHRSDAANYEGHVTVLHPGAELVLRVGQFDDVDLRAVESALAQWGVEQSAAGEILDVSVIKHLPAGSVIVAQGEEDPDFAYLISHGICSVYVNGEPRARLQSGEYFGEAAFLSLHGKRNADVRADTAVRLICVPGEYVRSLLANAETTEGKPIAGRLRKISEIRRSLQETHPFDELPVSVLNVLSAYAREVRLKPGDIAAKVADTGGWYVLTDGRVTVGDGNEATEEISPHHVIGRDISWPEGGEPTIVKAETDVSFVEIPAEVVPRLLQRSPRIRQYLHSASAHYSA